MVAKLLEVDDLARALRQLVAAAGRGQPVLRRGADALPARARSRHSRHDGATLRASWPRARCPRPCTTCSPRASTGCRSRSSARCSSPPCSGASSRCRSCERSRPPRRGPQGDRRRAGAAGAAAREGPVPRADVPVQPPPDPAGRLRGSLLRARAELHARAGAALERLYAGRADEVLQQLAEHYAPQRASASGRCAFLVRAGDRVASLFAYARGARRTTARALERARRRRRVPAGSARARPREARRRGVRAEGALGEARERWGAALAAAPTRRRAARCAELHRKLGVAAGRPANRERAAGAPRARARGARRTTPRTSRRRGSTRSSGASTSGWATTSRPSTGPSARSRSAPSSAPPT